MRSAVRDLDRGLPVTAKLAIPVIAVAVVDDVISEIWRGPVLLLEAALQAVTIVLVVHFVVVRRIRRLDRATARVAAGDLSARVGVRHADVAEPQDEIVRVSQAFDRMTKVLAEQRAAIEHLAETDALTGLLNRRALDVRLEREIAQATRLRYPLAFSLIDLDGFKQVNDSLGHVAGDEALRRIGAALREAVRRTDIVARYGGDEFAVIHPGCDLEHAGVVSRRIRDAIDALRVVPSGAGARPLTASVGTALLQPFDDADTLIAEADRRMYAAKPSRDRTLVGAAS